MSNTFPVRIREATDAEAGYIMKSWLETFRRESSWTKPMHGAVYYPNQRLIVTDLLERKRTVVACNDEDPTHVVGFACGESIRDAVVLHFVYVSFSVRRWGIGRMLLEHYGWREGVPVVATHWTRACNSLAHDLTLLYNPFLLFEDRGLREIAKGKDHDANRQTERGDFQERRDGDGQGPGPKPVAV